MSNMISKREKDKKFKGFKKRETNIQAVNFCFVESTFKIQGFSFSAKLRIRIHIKSEVHEICLSHKHLEPPVETMLTPIFAMEKWKKERKLFFISEIFVSEES